MRSARDSGVVSVPAKDTVAKPALAVEKVMPVSDSAKHVAAKHQPFQPNPKKAGLYAAILPGLGQIYNRQYWKLPIVYGGMAGATYFLVNNLKKYQDYRKEYINRIAGNVVDQSLKMYDINQLKQLQDDQYKNVNLTVLLTTVGYLAQVIDAITGAHLKNFDISRDISMRMQPAFYPKAAGIALVVNFN